MLGLIMIREDRAALRVRARIFGPSLVHIWLSNQDREGRTGEANRKTGKVFVAI
jgi:hypothetical protein